MSASAISIDALADSVPVPQDDFELHVTATTCTLFHVVRESGLSKNHLGFRRYDQWHIPRLAAQYLLECDGQATHADIAPRLATPFRTVLDDVALDLQAGTGAIAFATDSERRPRRIFSSGDFDSYAPLHMSVEITDTCNFECDHCYVSASPTKQGRRELASMLVLFDEMRDNGVKVVELTGGECTVHPHFREIVQAAAERFHLVAIITNGYLLGIRPQLVDFISAFDNVTVQMSIDGDAEFHDRFRHKPGSHRALCEAGRRLKERGSMVRFAMSVTPENVHLVPAVYQTAKEVGVDALAIAPVTTFGRASDFGLDARDDHWVQHEISRLLAPYADDPLFEANRLSAKLQQAAKEKNCGAGWRSFSLNGASGEIRSCLFLTDSKKFGNVDTADYASIFRSPYMSMFRNAPSPSVELDTCRDCTYLSTCQGCFAKAFRVSELDYPECPWRATYFPGMPLTTGDEDQSALPLCGCGSGTGHGDKAVVLTIGRKRQPEMSSLA
jgi:radical SAM protein with 4Fe4S-binding SPASM domain